MGVSKKNKPAKAHWSFVSNTHHLADIVRNKALLIGASVFVSARDNKAPGYTKLTPRAGVSAWAGLLSKNPPHLYVAVNDAVNKTAPKGTRFALAIDAYLQWGLKSKGKVLLIGGWEDANETNLDVLVFEDGRFIDYENKALPGREAAHFPDTVASLLDDYATSKPDFKVFHAAPLRPFGVAFAGVPFIDDRIFRKLSFRPLGVHSTSKFGGMVLPASLVAAGLVFGGAALAKGWSDYRGAVESFDREINDPVVTGQGGVDSGLIDTIQQRRFFLDEPRRQVSLVEQSKRLVAGVGKIKDLKIVEIKLPAPSLAAAGPSIGVPVAGAPAATGKDRKPDVWLRVSVPLQGGGAMDQGRGLMEEVSANTGMDVRLARQGWSDDGKRRIFTLEGFING